MKLAKENLGKVSITVEKAYHRVDKEYDKLVVVEEEGQFRTFISRKPVPVGIELTDREYWLPFSSVKESIVIDYNKFKQYIRTGEGLLDDSIVERHIKNRNITGDKIAENTITFSNIADNTITLDKINDEAIDTTLTKEGYLAEAKHTGDRLLNIEGLNVVKVSSTQSTVLDAWQIVDKKGNVHGVTINTYKDKSIDAIWLSINEDDPKPENLGTKVDNPRYLNIVYNKADGTQQKVSIPLASFVTEAEFSKNGFKVIDGVVNLKISSDITTSRYFHFDADGNITLDGFEKRILEDLGTLEHSESGDGTMWGEFKKQEIIREEVSNSAHQVFSDNWDAQDDDPELPQDKEAVNEASYAYNWKSTDTPASDGKTKGNLKDLYQKTLNQDSKLSELEQKLYNQCVIGAGLSFTPIKIDGLIPGVRYRLMFNYATPWNISEITSTTANIIYITRKNPSSGDTALSIYKQLYQYQFVSNYTQVIEFVYDGTSPDDYLNILIRANTGVKVLFNISDITNITSLNTSLNNAINKFSANILEIDGDILEIDGGVNRINIYNSIARDGSGNNSGNAKGVHTNTYIPVGRYGKVTVQFNKTLPSGHYFKYIFYESSKKYVFTDLGTSGALLAQSSETTVNTYTIRKKNCVGVVIAVWEYDANDVQQTLRYTDSDIPQNAFTVTIEGGLQTVIDYEAEQRQVVDSILQQNINTEIQRAQGVEQTLQLDIQAINEKVGSRIVTNSLKNGGTSNGSNSYKVRTICFDVRNLSGKINIYTDRLVDENATYYYEGIFTDDVNAIGKFWASNENPNKYQIISRFNKKKNGVLTAIPKNAVGLVIGIYEIPNGGSEGDITLRVTDFSGYNVGIDNIEGLQANIIELQTDVSELHNDVTELKEQISDDAYLRNKNKQIVLGAACRQRIKSNTSKDFQALIVTDSHEDNVAVKNAAIMANGFKSVAIALHCGDMEGDYMTPNDNMTAFINAMNVCTKPWFNVIGNHEAGTYNIVGYVPTVQHMYDVLIKPMVDKGLLLSGEYEVGKCHYYHDFTTYNIRMIVVNEYDGDLALDDTYWEAVAYDASAAEIAFGTTYPIGTILKMKGGYTDYCFKAKQEVTISSSIYNLNGKQPKYKAIPGYRMISQSQAQWFLDTLASTPTNYTVVVVMHNPFSNIARTQPTLKFNQTDTNIVGSSQAQNYIQNDFFADAVDAFVNGTSYSAKIVFKSVAAYRNVLNDGTIDYAYAISKDFSQKNIGVKFMCFLGGHVHKDLVWKHPTYTYQYQITPVCATTEYHQSSTSDIRRSNIDGLAYDSITTVSFDTDNNTISLAKIGVDITSEMEYRDFEKIKL